MVVTSSSRSDGFTLIELLVVLALAGLLVSVVTPNLVRLNDSVRGWIAEEQILSQFSQLPTRALAEGENYLVLSQSDMNAEETRHLYPSYTVYELDLPDGWSYTLDNPLQVKAIGICLGAELTLFNLGQPVRRLRLMPPECATSS